VEGDVDAELVGAGVETLPPDAEGPIDSTMPAEPLKPATHWLTYVLIGLNFIAAPAFGFFLLQDNQRKQEYKYANLQLDLAMLGLPTDEEEYGAVAARLIVPNTNVPAEQLTRDVMDKRGVKYPKNPDPAKGTEKDPVQPVSEQFNRRFKPSELAPVFQDGKEQPPFILKDHFGPDEPIVKTVDEEMQRLAKSTVAAMKEAASAMPANPDEQKKDIRKLLLPLAFNTVQVDKLNKRIAESQDIKSLYTEAAIRRMAFDFLLPLESFRPGDMKDFTLEKIGDLDAIKLDDVLKRVDERIASTIKDKYDTNLQLGEGWLNQPRETIEKRLMASFTMLALAYVKTPNGVRLEPKLLDRIPLVVGQYDAAKAAMLFPGLVTAMNDRVLASIKYVRDGENVKTKDGKDDPAFRIKSFADRYEDTLQQIRFVQQDTIKAKIRLKDLESDKARHEKLLTERKDTEQKILASIAEERARTQKFNNELRILQIELFGFQSRLATSEEELEQMNAVIQKYYRPTSSPKTPAKTPAKGGK
jgi:hypothetical protein